ncbi:MAG: cysteine-rich CWC family protein [Chitinophagaceae bacterium]|nr:cysteine-rich CWC family protein [Chitinophagaceae bacterium]
MKYPENIFRVFLCKEDLMEKVCPNCKKTFECKAQDIENCGCHAIQIDATTLELIQNQFNDCLCVECLQNLTN